MWQLAYFGHFLKISTSISGFFKVFVAQSLVTSATIDILSMIIFAEFLLKYWP